MEESIPSLYFKPYNKKYNDDCFKTYSTNRHEAIIILCDGVSGSTSKAGRIASFLVSYTVIEFYKENKELSNFSPFRFANNIINKLKESFDIFHLFLKEYSINKNNEIKLATTITEEDHTSDIKQSEDIDNSIYYAERFSFYANLFKYEEKDFEHIINSLNVEAATFATTITFLVITKADEQYWKILSFNLGDNYLLNTYFDHINKMWTFNDMSFNRLMGGNPNQFSSTKYVQGNFELKTSYIKKGSILSLATDGSKIKNIEHKDKKAYNYEYFKEFVDFLVDNIDDIKNTSKQWFTSVDSKEEIGDDFTLFSVLLNDYLPLYKDFESF